MGISASGLILTARHRRGWTQAELARRAGVSAPTLCAYERGARQPSVAMLDRILRAADIVIELRDLRAEHERQGRELLDVLELADALPLRGQSRTMPAPPFRSFLRA